MVMDIAFVIVVMPSSASTVKFDVPGVVGVPLMTPVEESKESPAGSEPEASDQL